MDDKAYKKLMETHSVLDSEVSLSKITISYEKEETSKASTDIKGHQTALAGIKRLKKTPKGIERNKAQVVISVCGFYTGMH